MVAFIFHPRPNPVFIVLMKDDTATTIYNEVFDSLSDARNAFDILHWGYPQAQLILMCKEGDAVQVLYTRNPLRV